jgi:L-amino acid N-acyltransferase YncA
VVALGALEIRDLRPGDWPEVAGIYAAGVATRNATFETDVPSWEEWDARHLARPRLVAVASSPVVGWAALSPVSTRACYAGVAEDSVYVAADRQGQGVGRALLEALVARSEAEGLWTLQTSIFPENRASIVLHLRCGFRVVGTRERIAQLDGVWRDTVLLERRAGAVPSQTPTHPGEPTSRVPQEGAHLCADLAPKARRAGRGRRRA